MSPLGWFVSVILPLIVCCLGWGALLLNEWHNKRQRVRGKSEQSGQTALEPPDAALVSKATLQAAAHLGLCDPVLATILGLPPSSVERCSQGQTPLIQDRLTLERATPLLRLSRAFRGDPKAAESWMRNHHTAFGTRPIDVLQTAGGVQRVLDHVHALLGKS